MRLIDSNILIYAGKAAYDWLAVEVLQRPASASIASKIEVLGFHRFTQAEKFQTEAFFALIEVLDLTSGIADTAVRLRQQRKMGLGDAIIAATALEHDLELVTRNTQDFDWIPGLKLWNPFDNQP